MGLSSPAVAVLCRAGFSERAAPVSAAGRLCDRGARWPATRSDPLHVTHNLRRRTARPAGGLLEPAEVADAR